MGSKKTLLVIDDEKSFCMAVRDYLEGETLNVLTANTGSDGIDVCSKRSVDVVLLDQRLPDGDGHNLVKDILKRNEQAKIVFITAYPSFENAVMAVRSGAYDYLSKPLDLDELRLVVERAVHTLELEQVAQIHEFEQERESELAVIIGREGGLAETAALVDSARKTDAPVLITGETGTGKNLVAKAIHYRAGAKSGPFISINCAALPENLIEAELFGYERGAFTGAVGSRKGLFEMADGGSLFLDEIGEMPYHLQSKLLSAIEEGSVRRIGGTTSRTIKVRMIAATNSTIEKNLGTTFRKDLYYRLSVIRIHVPALRERTQDIPGLCRYFLEKINSGDMLDLTPHEMENLIRYSWPGNVRELSNVLERAALVQRGGPFRPSLLLGISAPSDPSGVPTLGKEEGSMPTLAEAERRLITAAFHRYTGNLTRTAEALDISLSTLKRKVREYGLK